MISVFESLTLASLGQSEKRRLKVARIGRGAGSDGEAIAIIAESTVDPFDIALVSGTGCDRGNRNNLAPHFSACSRAAKVYSQKFPRRGRCPAQPRLDTAGAGRDAGAWVARGSRPAPGLPCLVLPRFCPP